MMPGVAPGMPAPWLLAVGADAGSLVYFLTDLHTCFAHARLSMAADADRAVMPDGLAARLRDGGARALGLQLPQALDHWAWESLLDSLAPGLRVVRLVADAAGVATLPGGSTPAAMIDWLHGDEPGWTRRAMAALHAGGALVAVDGTVAVELAQSFRETALRLWHRDSALSEATAAAASSVGLDRALWRQYGDARRPADADRGSAEWRAVTTVSVDLIQSTILLQEWGAERYADTHARFHALWRRIVEQHGGRLDDPRGNDGTMAYFGLRGAGEDSAARAVGAAWTLTQEAPRLGLALRVGICTGRVAISDGQPFGVAIHLAARLQAIAPPNAIVIADATHALLGPGVDCEALAESPSLRGFDQPQRVWRVRGIKQAQKLAWQRPGRGRFVGRETELGILLTDLNGVVCERIGRSRALIGEPGVGKSRLLHEFVQAARRRHPSLSLLKLVGQAPMQASAFAALKLATEDAPFQPLAAALEDPGSGTSPDAVHLPFGGTDRIAAALDATLALCADGPVCVVADDAQWLDPSTLEWLIRLHEVRTRVPLLLLISLREEARARLSALTGDDALSLAPLNAVEALELIGSLTDSVHLTPALRDAIAARGGGIPLFIEETARMVSAAVDPAMLDGTIPATLDELLTARLDQLGDAKPLAQLAAVLGTEFPLSLWNAVLAESGETIGHGNADAFRRLWDSGLVTVADTTPPRCRFRHALIRDAAYESLWQRDRQRLHMQVARVLARADGCGGPSSGEQLAHHLTAAGQLEAALAAWTRAARAAAAAGAEREALALARRALTLTQQLPDSEALRRQALQLHLLQAARCIAIDGYSAPSVEAAYLHAAALCGDDPTSDTRLRVDLGLEACYAMRGDLDRARALAEGVLRHTPWERNLRLALQARWAWTNVVFHQGDLRAALDMADACLARYQPSLHQRGAVQDPAVMFLCYSGWGWFQGGRAQEARRRVAQALALAEELDHPFSQAIAHGFVASVALFCGDFQDGLVHAEEALRRCGDRSFAAWQAHARIIGGRLRAALGEVQAGLQDMSQGLELWIGTGARITVATYLAMRAEVLLAHDRAQEALALLEEARAIAERHGERYHMAELLRLSGCAHWMLRADAEQGQHAQALLRQALALAQSQHNDGFVLRAAMALGQTQAECSQAEAAAELLRWSLHAVPEQAETADGRAARMLLERWDGAAAQSAPTPTPAPAPAGRGVADERREEQTWHGHGDRRSISMN